MYICMYVYMYVCIYVHMYICTYVYMCVCIYVHMYICIYVYMYIYVYVRMLKTVHSTQRLQAPQVTTQLNSTQLKSLSAQYVMHEHDLSIYVRVT